MAEKTPHPRKWPLTGLGSATAFSTLVETRPASLPTDATYFNRKLLVTTVTLESAMAADASMGESRPSAATGMPITL